MKVNSSDTRRVHTTVRYGRESERTETVTWGDVRFVGIVLESGDELPDMFEGGYYSRGPRKLFRPVTAHMEWKRNSHYSTVTGSGRWVKDGNADLWVLTNAGIRGTNVRADGSLGKLNTCALYANDDGYGINEVLDPPPWFAKLLAEHDPNLNGSPLDKEKTS